MAKKKKKPELIKIWYNLEECAKLAKVYTNEVRDILHKEKITTEIREGYFYINKNEFDKYLQ